MGGEGEPSDGELVSGDRKAVNFFSFNATYQDLSVIVFLLLISKISS
jgi:hypothetical protein